MRAEHLEQWEQTQAELEIRRWLVAHNLWAPDAARRVATLETLPAPVQPAARLAALALEWPTLRQELEAQLQARAQANPQLDTYHAARQLQAFEQVVQAVAALAVQLAPPPAAPQETDARTAP